MSLNWKEINLILDELDLPGSQIQAVMQSAFDVVVLRTRKTGKTSHILIALTPGACRLHETFAAVPKTDKPLRYAQFLNSRITNGWIEEAAQLGDNRIVRIVIRRAENRYLLFVRLWSNAANCIVTSEDGTILDAMRRLPKKGEVSGGHYAPDAPAQVSHNTAETGKPMREYVIRELPGEFSFNQKIDSYYAEHGGALSLDALREQARRHYENSAGKIQAALEKLRAKETEFCAAEKLREYGDIILANIASIKEGDAWLEAEDFFSGGSVRIKLDPRQTPAAQSGHYYDQYRKAKKGLADVQSEIASGERELQEVKSKLARLLTEENPLILAKLLKTGGVKSTPRIDQDKKRPGLSFRRGDWLIMVGRDARENDALLRRHVKGNDLWLHVRDFPGSYVFIKQRSGKTVPLEILLDAANLALFYSKGRNNGEADLFYTHVKYLRRAKNAPKGTVLPTQEKNLHIKADERRLKELENCRVEK